MKITEMIYDAKTKETKTIERELTQQEIDYAKRDKLEKDVQNLKTQLNATDYKAIKYAEGELTEEEYAPIKAQRKAWREEINRLEEELKGE